VVELACLDQGLQMIKSITIFIFITLTSTVALSKNVEPKIFSDIQESVKFEEKAKQAFSSIEVDFQRYEAIQPQGRTKSEQIKLIESKTILLDKLEKSYREVFKYKHENLELKSAIYYRLARIHELFFIAFAACEILEQGNGNGNYFNLENKRLANEHLQTAQQRYMTLITQARELNLYNVWISKSSEAMNKYLPEDYPLQKTSKPNAPLGLRAK
jgi:hypothetical protein